MVAKAARVVRQVVADAGAASVGQSGKGGIVLTSSSLPHFQAGSQVEKTVESAARRRMLMEGLEQSGWTAIFLLSGLIVLILAGSAIFQWYWLMLLGVAGAGFAAYRIRQQLLPRYAVAQMLDRRLHLSDTLSTAYYLKSSTVDASGGAFQYQLEQADRLAAGVETGQSFPFAGQRVWSVAALLAVVSLGLFGVRYMVTESLSLRPAMVSLQISPLIEHIQEILSPKKKDKTPDSLANKAGSKAEEADGKEAQNSPAPEPQPTPPPSVANAAADGSPAGQQAATDSAKAGNDGQQSEAKPGDASSARQENGKEPGSSGLPQPGDASKKTDGAQAQSQTKEQPAGKQNSSPGVVSRMKEALSSMMAKMQASSSKQEAKGGQQESTDQKSSSQQAQASGKPQQGSQSQQQAPNQSSNPNESAEGQAQGQTAEKQGTSQGKSSDQSAQKGSDAHSGVGQQDGDKDIKDAEQMKAMGKLAEIIGKRSANLTGDMTVETSSGKQQLKTGYSQKVGAHSDSGGEINRNQVPLEYQPYVREYMEQVRKQEKGQ